MTENSDDDAVDDGARRQDDAAADAATDAAGDDPTDYGAAEPQLSHTDIAWFMFETLESQYRMYDVLLALYADAAGRDRARFLQDKHARGQFMFPPAWQADAAATDAADKDDDVRS